MPIRRITSATGVPVSACLSAYAICSSVYLDFFTACSFLTRDHNAGKLTFNLAEKCGGTSNGDAGTKGLKGFVTVSGAISVPSKFSAALRVRTH